MLSLKSVLYGLLAVPLIVFVVNVTQANAAGLVDNFEPCLSQTFNFDGDCEYTHCSEKSRRHTNSIEQRIEDVTNRLLRGARCFEDCGKSGTCFGSTTINPPKSYKDIKDGGRSIFTGINFAGKASLPGLGDRTFNCELGMVIYRSDAEKESGSGNSLHCFIDRKTSDFFTLEICNHTDRSVSTATVTTNTLGDPSLQVKGWWTTPPQSCKEFGPFIKGPLYLNAHDLNDASHIWRGRDLRACVTYPGPFTGYSTNEECSRKETEENFYRKAIAPDANKFTWDIADVPLP